MTYAIISFIPSSFIFLIGSIRGILISISRDNWFGAWFGFELNLIIFIPLILGAGHRIEVESRLKYFLVQVIGSVVFLWGIFLSVNYDGDSIITVYNSYKGGLVIWSGLIIKLGVVPFQLWVPARIAGVSWFCCFLLSTLQKIAPLVFLIFFCETYRIWGVLVGGLRRIVGGIGGINQTQLRPLIGYSSIGHIGWILGGLSSGGTKVAIFYFSCYFIVSLGLFLYLRILGIFYLKSFSQAFLGIKRLSLIYLSLFLLSIRGFPPFLIFLGKISILYRIFDFYIWIPLYLLGALVRLYYYLNLMLSWILSRCICRISSEISLSNSHRLGIRLLLGQFSISFIIIFSFVIARNYDCTLT